MTTRGYCNEMYYGKKLSVKEILSSTTRSNDNGVTYKQSGKARMLRKNRDYETLIQMLNDYCVDENLDNNNYKPPPMNTPSYSFHKKQNDKYQPMNGKAIQNGKHNGKNGKVNGKKLDSKKYKNGKKKKKKSKKEQEKEDYPFEYREDQDDVKHFEVEQEEQYEEEYEEEYVEDQKVEDQYVDQEHDEEEEEEEEEDLQVNDDNLGNKGNAEIWNQKVY